MSTWLDLINDLKRRYTSEYLTSTQQAARGDLCQLMSAPNWVNLYGPPGAGKTFVGWAVARATGATYVPTPDKLKELQPGHEGLIVDNSPYRETEVRNVFAQCGLLNCYTVLLVTRQNVAMPMYRIELLLPTREEVEMVIRTLARLSYVCDTTVLPDAPTFWNVIMACV